MSIIAGRIKGRRVHEKEEARRVGYTMSPPGLTIDDVMDAEVSPEDSDVSEPVRIIGPLGRPMKPTQGCPLMDLPPELKDRIFSLLSKASIRRLCRVSKDMCQAARPHLYNHLKFSKYYCFIQVAESLLFASDDEEDSPDWVKKALVGCRSIELEHQHNPERPVTCGNEFRYRYDLEEQRFIATQLADTLTSLVDEMENLKQLSWKMCGLPPSFASLFSALSTQPLQRLAFSDVCEHRVENSATAFSAGFMSMMSVLGWDHLTNLEPLTHLEIESTVHPFDGATVVSPALDALLLRVPNVTSLKLRMEPGRIREIACARLHRLAELHLPKLKSLHLENAGAPSQLALQQFLSRHVLIEQLTVVGPPSGPLPKDGPYSTRNVAFTVPQDSEVYLPNLKQLCVSSMRLQNAIVRVSDPESIKDVRLDLRGESVGQGQPFHDEDPMDALSQLHSVLEMSLIIRGHSGHQGWEDRVSEAISKLPSSLLFLTLRLPDADDAPLPLSMPLEAFGALINLRVLVMPHEVLYESRKTLLGAAAGARGGSMSADLTIRAAVKTGCEEASTQLGKHLPRLDFIIWLGSKECDYLGRPIWPVEFIFKPRLGKNLTGGIAFWVSEIDRHKGPPPATASVVCRMQQGDRLGSMLSELESVANPVRIRKEAAQGVLPEIVNWPAPQAPTSSGKKAKKKKKDKKSKAPQTAEQVPEPVEPWVGANVISWACCCTHCLRKEWHFADCHKCERWEQRHKGDVWSMLYELGDRWRAHGKPDPDPEDGGDDDPTDAEIFGAIDLSKTHFDTEA